MSENGRGNRILNYDQVVEKEEVEDDEGGFSKCKFDYSLHVYVGCGGVYLIRGLFDWMYFSRD